LKPFGFCIHGAIHGYSRRILWLEVGSSNNNPRIVGKYFLDCVVQVGELLEYVVAMPVQKMSISLQCSRRLSGEQKLSVWKIRLKSTN
jgi:hypothetical protein